MNKDEQKRTKANVLHKLTFEPEELWRKATQMEALMIINSILVIKDAHGDFKEVVKKVSRLEEKVKGISAKMSANGRTAETPKE